MAPSSTAHNPGRGHGGGGCGEGTRGHRGLCLYAQTEQQEALGGGVSRSGVTGEVACSGERRTSGDATDRSKVRAEAVGVRVQLVTDLWFWGFWKSPGSGRARKCPQNGNVQRGVHTRPGPGG